MQIPKKLQTELINSRLIKFYRTEKPFRTDWFDGLGNLEWFKIVFELGSGVKYKLEEDDLSKWTENETLIEYPTKQTADFKNQKIAQILIKIEYEGIFIKLENQMVIYHRTFFGSELTIEKYEEVFDKNGEVI